VAPHPLDNPVRSSLAGPHARLAERRGNVLRYPADVCPFLAMPDEPDAADWADAAALVGPGGLLPLAGVQAPPPAGWAVEIIGEGVQMTGDGALTALAKQDGPRFPIHRRRAPRLPRQAPPPPAPAEASTRSRSILPTATSTR